MAIREMKTLLLSLLLFIFVVGCSNNEEANQSEEVPEATTNPEDVGYPDEITYWTELHPSVANSLEDLNGVGVYQELEKATGTKVSFQHPSGEGTQITEQFNLLIASGNLPDVIEYNWHAVQRGPDNAIDSGTIIRLNELIEAHAPNLSKYLEENPEVKKSITTDGGNIYAFPFLRSDEKLMVFMGPIIRQDWLDKLNLEMPTTIDEWENVLRTIKDGDPNGNGEKDEIPLLLHPDQFKNLGAFASAWGMTPMFYHENGTVKFGSIQPEYKEFLSRMNSWYEDGLLDADFAATDLKLQDAKVTNNQLGSLYGYTGGGIGKYTGLMADKNPEFKLAPAPNPSLKEGEKAARGHRDFPYSGWHSVAITGNAENPEEIVKWLDYAYSEEGHFLFNFGVEGVSYEVEDGYPKYTDEVMENPDGLPVSDALGKYVRSSYGGPFIQDVRYLEQYLELPEQKDAIQIWSDSAENEILLPLITLTAEESREYASIMSDLETYYDEMVVKFIMGAEPLENFDKFVETLKGMGIERAIELQQAALERYEQR
ncbi:extracellular solute-binding protein [Halalkalibacter urbisdiaboli]|uniref:extracellular solute-binding protein n=1 Tax=Halalkalibacter urbisdiaboli TaxID=1960589 RepID=UPI000B447C58|nr:extracellular solute-binding protein [Halalkalibacter urbisdiaboli]